MNNFILIIVPNEKVTEGLGRTIEKSKDYFEFGLKVLIPSKYLFIENHNQKRLKIGVKAFCI